MSYTNNLNLSIGILTWGSYLTLVNTLESYKKSGLLDMVKDVTIFAQDAKEEDINIADIYQVNIIASPTNVGIGKGLTRLAQFAKTDNILLLENDWVNICDTKDTYDRLLHGIRILINNKADVVKYRHRKNPGDPLYTRQFAGNEMRSPRHLLDCVHWREHPDKDFPDFIQKDIDTGMYITNSKYANQTNNPCMFRRDFYLKNISPFSGDGVALEGAIENWWTEQNFTVAHGEGLFTHYRIDR